MPFREDVFGANHSFERAITADFVLFMKRWEGWRPTRYPDGKRADGSIVYSICYGHKEDGDNPPFKITEDMKFTEEEGTSILVNDIKRQAHYINVRVKAKLTTFQFEALTSLCFQYGLGRLDKTGIFAHINSGDYDGAADLMLDLYKTQAGKPLRGLRFRRAAEVTWFITKKD